MKQKRLNIVRAEAQQIVMELADKVGIKGMNQLASNAIKLKYYADMKSTIGANHYREFRVHIHITSLINSYIACYVNNDINQANKYYEQVNYAIDEIRYDCWHVRIQKSFDVILKRMQSITPLTSSRLDEFIDKMNSKSNKADLESLNTTTTRIISCLMIQ